MSLLFSQTPTDIPTMIGIGQQLGVDQAYLDMAAQAAEELSRTKGIQAAIQQVHGQIIAVSKTGMPTYH